MVYSRYILEYKWELLNVMGRTVTILGSVYNRGRALKAIRTVRTIYKPSQNSVLGEPFSVPSRKGRPAENFKFVLKTLQIIKIHVNKIMQHNKQHTKSKNATKMWMRLRLDKLYSDFRQIDISNGIGIILGF